MCKIVKIQTNFLVVLIITLHGLNHLKKMVQCLFSQLCQNMMRANLVNQLFYMFLRELL